MSIPKKSEGATKICRKCEQQKPVAEFRKRGGRCAHLTRPDCKVCERPKRAAQRTKDRLRRGRTDIDREKGRRWYAARVTAWTEAQRAKERERSSRKNRTDSYRQRNRQRLRVARLADPIGARDKSISEYYHRKGLPPELIEARLALVRLKRIVQEQYGRRDEN